MNTSRFPRIIPALCFIAPSCFLVGGCASPAKSTSMVPQGMTLERHHPSSVHVTTAVMEESAEKGILRSPEFAKAISEAIRQSGLFASVKADGADYLLDVRITGAELWNWHQLECPIKLRSVWKLTRVSDGQVLATEFIQAENRVTVGEAVVGATRARLSVEGATNKLIRSGIERLSRLSL